MNKFNIIYISICFISQTSIFLIFFIIIIIITDLCQPSPNVVSVIPFENDKFKPDDTKIFSIGMVGMGKAKKDNVLKPNGIP